MFAFVFPGFLATETMVSLKKALVMSLVLLRTGVTNPHPHGHIQKETHINTHTTRAHARTHTYDLFFLLVFVILLPLGLPILRGGGWGS